MEVSSSKPRPSASIPNCSKSLEESRPRLLIGVSWNKEWIMNKRDHITRDEASPSAAESPPTAPGRESQAGAHAKPMIMVEYKHSIATRWMHWINFPLLFLMIYSGILIYWAEFQVA